MRKHFLTILALVLVAQMGWAVDPSTDLQTYYAGADGKSGEAIRSALYDKINSHTTVSYDNLKYLFKWTDTYNNAGAVIDDIYSECDPAYTESWCSGDCGYNREHSLPKSWFNEASVLYSDAFHLYPTNCYVNSFRGNLAFGECSGGEKCTTNGVKGKGRRGTSTFSSGGVQYTFSDKVYEPDDEFKGDLARSYFYMVTCYMHQNFTYADGGIYMFTYANNTAQLSQYSIDLLLKWHRQDPVSERELVRNEVIYGNTTYNKCSYKQGNRNPFIDYPCLAEYIWGEHQGETLDLATLVSGYDGVGTDCCGSATAPAITSPKGSIDLGTTDTEHTATKDITITGINLEDGNLTLALSGANASYFLLAATTVTSAQATAGYVVTISYAPTAEGTHNATLTISGCGITGHSVSLTGKCTDVHTITWIDDQGQQTTMVETGGALTLPTNTPADCSKDRVFVGWTAQSSVSAEPTDLFTEASGTVTAPATYHAVYADKAVEGGGPTTYVLTNSIAAGDKVIIACSSQNVTAGGLNGTYLDKVASTFSSNEITSLGTGTQIFTVGGSAGAWTLTSDAGTLYSSAAKSVNFSNNGTGTWNITFDGTTANIKSGNSSYGSLQYNSGSPRFTTYTSAQKDVQLYKVTGGTTITYSNYSLHCSEIHTGLDSATDEKTALKFFIDGQIYILVGESLYNLQSQRVK